MKALSKVQKKWLAGIILILLAVGATLFIVYGGSLFSQPLNTVENLVTAMNEKDGDLLISCFPPSTQETMKSRLEDAGGAQQFFADNYAATFTSDAPYQDFGENVLISLSDAKTQSQTIVDGRYNGVDMEALGASDVATVTCTMTTKGSLSEASETVQVTCVKIDGDWYILTMVTLEDTAVTPTDTN